MLRGTVNRSIALAACLGLAGCSSSKTYATTVEILQVERFGEETPSQLGLELRYAECPGDGRRILRTDAAFAKCAGAIKTGGKLRAEIVSSYSSERGSYRSDVVKLGDCALKLDPREEANYEMYQSCSPVETTGAVVGVRCDRTRSADLVAKCPWLKRR